MSEPSYTHTYSEEPVVSQTPPTPSEKPPWNPTLFTGMAFLFSFAASGILAGINWRRLGKPERTWSTIFLSLAGMAAFLAALTFLPISEDLAELVGYGINIGIGGLLTYLQLPAHKEWTATYGETTMKESGYLIPIAVGILTVVVLGAIILIGPSAITVGDAVNHFNRGVDYQEQGQLDLAIEAYTEAIAINPDFADAYLNRGVAYSEKGDFDQAIVDYNKAIEINPQFADAYSNRGVAYAVTGQYDQALVDLDKAIELDASLARTYFVRGALYSDLGEREKAMTDIEKALELGLEPEAQQFAEDILEELTQ
ncbi:MAG: tetratricopeptide repeat protein [Anaerolineales bacterium]|nr:tetratricopeptide repeat protein [Anaerolineales bacterium]